MKSYQLLEFLEGEGHTEFYQEDGSKYAIQLITDVLLNQIMNISSTIALTEKIIGQ